MYKNVCGILGLPKASLKSPFQDITLYYGNSDVTCHTMLNIAWYRAFQAMSKQLNSLRWKTCQCINDCVSLCWMWTDIQHALPNINGDLVFFSCCHFTLHWFPCKAKPMQAWCWVRLQCLSMEEAYHVTLQLAHWWRVDPTSGFFRVYELLSGK